MKDVSENSKTERACLTVNERTWYLTEAMRHLKATAPEESCEAATAAIEDYDEFGDKQPWMYLDDATTDRQGLLDFIEEEMTCCFEQSEGDDPVAYLAVATPGSLREHPGENIWDWAYGSSRELGRWQENGYEVVATASPSRSEGRIRRRTPRGHAAEAAP